jgi:hypothetical protein
MAILLVAIMAISGYFIHAYLSFILLVAIGVYFRLFSP